MDFSEATIKRFWSKVDIGLAEQCWDWKGAMSDKGYGIFELNGTRMASSRVSLIFMTGIIPNGKYACHHCDNKACCNPSHLYWGTPRDNILDVWRRNKEFCLHLKERMRELGKNRRWHSGRPRKMTQEMLDAARQRVLSGEKQCAVARDIGVSDATLSKHLNGLLKTK